MFALPALDTAQPLSYIRVTLLTPDALRQHQTSVEEQQNDHSPQSRSSGIDAECKAAE